MANEHGNLSINSQNIFPIIKKWMYSDHDIFIRELVSNGCDAITKYKKLDMMGECELPDDYKGKIQVIVNPEEKKVSVRPVTLGPNTAETAAIEKGLEPGEQVVVDGADKLRQDAKVEVITPEARQAAADKGNGERRDGKRKPGGGAPENTPSGGEKRPDKAADAANGKGRE